MAQITELTKNQRLLGSWLSVNGVVVPDDNYYEDEDCGSHNFVEISDVVVNTSHPSGLSGFLSGILRIRGLCVSLSYSDCFTWDNQRNGLVIPINIFFGMSGSVKRRTMKCGELSNRLRAGQRQNWYS